jgi:hypothetical protein
MARETARVRSQNAYKGALGSTQTTTVHVTTARGDLVTTKVYTSIDALTDPELVEKLYADTLNTFESARIHVPVVFHDPAAEVMVLVLTASQRHREIDERIALLARLRDDGAAVPAYAKDFAVVFDGAGLRTYLEGKARQLLFSRDLEKRESEVQRAAKQLEAHKAELAKSRAEHEQALAEHHRAHLELERMRAEARARVIAAVQETTIGAPPQPAPPEDIVTKPIGLQDLEDIERKADEHKPTNGVHARGAFDDEKTGYDSRSIDDLPPPLGEVTPPPPGFGELEPPPLADIDATPLPVPLPDPDDVEADEETTGSSPPPTGADPMTTDTIELDVDANAKTTGLRVEGGAVRLGLVAGEHLAKGPLDIRVLLHRLPTYPVVVLVIGSPSAMRAPSPAQLAVVPVEISGDTDRAVLTCLAKRFEITVDVIVHGKPARRVKLTAPLAENVGYIIRAADDHLRGITADGETEPSFSRARDIVLGAGYDLLGVEHAEATEFRDDKLGGLLTANNVRRAIAIARRFARPSREDYLVCARSYPLVRWRELRREVLAAAVRWGLWMGPELAQIAVSEGLARSRRDLIVKLDAGFEELRKDAAAFVVDADAADDNLKELAEEARALGVELRRGKKNNGVAIKSEEEPVVSGSIERTPPAGVTKAKSIDELITMLDDKATRIAAATELCDRGDARAAAPVIAAAKKLSRAEAVRILGKSVKFGSAAAKPLIEGLQSSKAFLRHGCALALALLRDDNGTHAVIELLMSEPTEIWREIARAIGQIGPNALMPLASHVGRLGSDGVTPQIAERVSWAMAHVGVRGGKAALEQMANGQSVMAPIAKQALNLHSNAARDEVRVRPGQATKDVTVNRAFSRRFFEALEADRPDVAQAALHDLDASGPLELDDSDLILDEEDDEAELDESDLIQT